MGNYWFQPKTTAAGRFVDLSQEANLKVAFDAATKLWGKARPDRRDSIMELIDSILDLHNTVSRL